MESGQFDDILDSGTACCHNAFVSSRYHSIIAPDARCSYITKYFKTTKVPMKESQYKFKPFMKVKRHRRKSEEIYRRYNCNFEGCLKSYEKISHLNTHRQRKCHGPNMSILFFKKINK